MSRFQVVRGPVAAHAKNAVEYVVRADCATCYDLFLVDTKTGMILASDAGYFECPEDMTFDRALSKFVYWMNALDEGRM